MDWGFFEGLNKKTDEEKIAKKKERSDLERNNNNSDDDGSDDKSQESATSAQETWDKKSAQSGNCLRTTVDLLLRYHSKFCDQVPMDYL